MPKFAFKFSRIREEKARVVIEAKNANQAFNLIHEIPIDDLRLAWRFTGYSCTHDIGAPVPVGARTKITQDVQTRIDAPVTAWKNWRKKKKKKNERTAR